MSSERLWDEFLDLQESYKELTERLRVACETIGQLKRANKEWETLWKPIDDLVRPLTPLGESVGDKVVKLISRQLAGFTEQELEDMWETYNRCFNFDSTGWLDWEQVFKDGVRIALMEIK